MSNIDKIKTALQKIDEGLKSINTNEDWLEFLKFQSRFYNYSYGNTLLIFLQNPNASYVKGYSAWNKLGRHVKKGAKAIRIVAPFIKKVEVFKEPDDKREYQDKEAEKEVKEKILGFRVANVFDITDTEGNDDNLPVLVRGLKGNTSSDTEIYDHLRDVFGRDFSIREVEETLSLSKGSFNLDSLAISVRSDLDCRQKVKTLLHELAHAYDFQMNPDTDIPRNRREIIAESVAFVVSNHLGIDTSAYSLSYIQSWLKNQEEIKIIADTVQKISYAIISRLAESSDSAFSLSKEV